jgi:hypothetical protein
MHGDDSGSERSDDAVEMVDFSASPTPQSLEERVNELEEQNARLHQRLANEGALRQDLPSRVLVLESAAIDARNAPESSRSTYKPQSITSGYGHDSRTLQVLSKLADTTTPHQQ